MKTKSPVLLALVVLLLPALAWAEDGGEFAKTIEKGWLWAYLVAFGTGVLTSLTPCVYPMIPITVAVFGSKDEDTTRAKALALAACYVGGMGLLYAVLGVSFAAAGKQAGSLLADPRVVVPLALLLVALAASMFGAFEIRLPYALQNRLNQVGGKGYGGAFGMGLVGGLIAAPCTGPLLASLLIWVAATQNLVLGGTLLFVYALGVGVLFFILAVTSLALPKSGSWMDKVKSFGGISLLATAVHFLRPVLPLIDEHSLVIVRWLGTPIIAVGLGGAIAVAGILAGAVRLSFKKDGAESARKGLTVALVVAGATLAISGFLAPEKPLEWHHDEARAFADAKSQGKGVVIDFGATWCAPCKLVEKVFGEPKVYSEVNDSFVPLKFDVSDLTETDVALQNKYNAHSLPAVVFLDSQGNELVRYSEKSPEAGTMLKTVLEAREKLRASGG